MSCNAMPMRGGRYGSALISITKVHAPMLIVLLIMRGGGGGQLSRKKRYVTPELPIALGSSP